MIEVQGLQGLFPRTDLAKGETEFSGNKLHEVGNPAGEKKAFVVFVIQMGSESGVSRPLWGQEGGAGSWAFLCPKAEALLWDLECALVSPSQSQGPRVAFQAGHPCAKPQSAECMCPWEGVSVCCLGLGKSDRATARPHVQRPGNPGPKGQPEYF